MTVALDEWLSITEPGLLPAPIFPNRQYLLYFNNLRSISAAGWACAPDPREIRPAALQVADCRRSQTNF